MEEVLTDEELYSTCSKHLNELVYTDNFPISLEEKRNLWFQIYETMQRHEEDKKSSKETEENFRKFGEGLVYLETSLYDLKENIGKLNGSAKIAAINGQIAVAKMKDALRLIDKTKKNVIETTKGLQRKLDVKNTILGITLRMVNQEPKK
jgi:hypothetical protein